MSANGDLDPLSTSAFSTSHLSSQSQSQSQSNASRPSTPSPVRPIRPLPPTPPSRSRQEPSAASSTPSYPSPPHFPTSPPASLPAAFSKPKPSPSPFPFTLPSSSLPVFPTTVPVFPSSPSAMPRPSSFDEDTLAHGAGGPVMDSVDADLRKMVAMMPGRNEDRMFSDDSAPRHPTSAPSTLTRRSSPDDPQPDSGSYYYYYSSEAGNTTRRDFSSGVASEAGPDAAPASAADEASSDDDDDDVPSPPPHSPAHSPAHAHTPAHSPSHPSPSSAALSAAIRRELPPPDSVVLSMASSARDNIADALALAGNRFLSDDMSSIAGILRRRFADILPVLRRLLAHTSLVIKNVAHLRRAVAAFARVLHSDRKIQDLAKRLGWVSADTLRVALSFVKWAMENAVRAWVLLRDTVIPGMRVALPEAYAKIVYAGLGVAAKSPWAMVLGPISLTLALSAGRMPDPLWLHRKLGVGYGAVEGVEDDGGSLSYEYTYGSGTTRADGQTARTGMTARTGKTMQTDDTGEYYYTYGSGTYADGDRGVSGGGTQPFGEVQEGRASIGSKRRSQKGSRVDKYDKENGPQEYVYDGDEYGGFNDAGGDAEYQY